MKWYTLLMQGERADEIGQNNRTRGEDEEKL